MIKLDIALRYAKVLFNLYPKETENWMNNFDIILKLFNSNKVLVDFLIAPQIATKQKKETLETLLSSTLSQEFLQFIVYLITKGHFKYLSAIADKYKDLFNKQFNIWEAVMVVPSAIDSELEEKLIKTLEHFFHKKIKINKRVDPKIIGGAVLIMGDTMIDLSIASRLKKMKESLLKHDI